MGTRLLTALAVVVADLMPLVAFHTGQASVGDLLLVVWCDGLLVGVVTGWRISTAAGRDPAEGSAAPRLPLGAERVVGDVGRFAVAYGGGTLLLGFFVLQVLEGAPSRSGPLVVAGLVLAMALGHVLTQLRTWTAERRAATTRRAAATAAYPRLLVTFLGSVACFILLVEGDRGVVGGSAAPVVAATVLCLLVTAYDLDELFTDGRVAVGTPWGLGFGPRGKRRR